MTKNDIVQLLTNLSNSAFFDLGFKVFWTKNLIIYFKHSGFFVTLYKDTYKITRTNDYIEDELISFIENQFDDIFKKSIGIKLIDKGK